MPSRPMYFSARSSVLWASSIFAARSPMWMVDQERLAVDMARVKVFWQTTRIGVMATLIEPLPSWELLNTR